MKDGIKGFRSFSDSIAGALEERRNLNVDKLCTTGIPFLDKHFVAIHPNSLYVITADSGVGKTSMISLIAQHNMDKDIPVACLFLEGDSTEFEKVQTWKQLVKLKLREGPVPNNFNYAHYRVNALSGIEDLERKAEEMVLKRYGKILLLNREEVVNSETIEGILTRISKTVSLIVIDHLHYFDKTFSETQNKEITTIMKKLQKFTDVMGVPVILVAHVKKPFGKRMIIMDKYDVKGSSSIYQEADECIMFAQYLDDPEHDIMSDLAPTLIRVVKSRSGISSMLIGKHIFDRVEKEYRKEFTEYRLVENYYDRDNRIMYPQKL